MSEIICDICGKPDYTHGVSDIKNDCPLSMGEVYFRHANKAIAERDALKARLSEETQWHVEAVIKCEELQAKLDELQKKYDAYIELVKVTVHQDKVLCDEHNGLQDERDAYKTALKEICDYAALDPDNDEYPVKVARDALKGLWK